jgi:predicted transcriptional regulator
MSAAGEIRCNECGKYYRYLYIHLGRTHRMSSEEYRKKWGIPADRELVAPDVCEARRQTLAVEPRVFSRPEDVSEHHERELITCLECGHTYRYLPVHLKRSHGLSCEEYRQRWGIPKSVALTGTDLRELCRQNTLRRTLAGEINTPAQLKKMSEARSKAGYTVSELQRSRAREKINQNRIWLKSPAVKKVSDDIKQEAARRMRARPETGETAAVIAADMGVAISALYTWMSKF